MGITERKKLYQPDELPNGYCSGCRINSQLAIFTVTRSIVTALIIMHFPSMAMFRTLRKHALSPSNYIPYQTKPRPRT